MGTHPSQTHDCNRDSTLLEEEAEGLDLFPILFLYHYTDPFRESIVSAFNIVGAHAQPPNTQEDRATDGQLLEGDVTSLFGMFSDLFMETRADTSIPRLSGLTPSQSPISQTRIDELWSRLLSHHGNCQKSRFFSSGDFPMNIADAVFTAKNFEDCIWAYFTVFHPQHPFVHWPTFDIHTVSLPLLLSVVFAGSVHCTPRDAALSTRIFFDLGEDLIFKHLRETVARNSVDDCDALSIVQAALLILGLQVSFNNEAIRCRIRISRHPELVASMRSLGLTDPRSTSPLDAFDWRLFIAEESRVR